MAGTGPVIGGIAGISVVVVALVVIAFPPLEYGSHTYVDTRPATIQAEGSTGTDELPLPQIFRISEPSVVQIRVDKGENQRAGLGSGFVYDKRGHIVTNAHVVDEYKEARITFPDGNSFNGVVIGTNADTDIAVLLVDVNESYLHPMVLGDSAEMMVGERIAAIGNPFGLSGSMTSGIISQRGRLLPQESGFSNPDILQTDAAINPGNSGGPLLNMRGEVIGINTAIRSNTGEFAGIGFAVPSNTLKKIVPALIQQGEYHYPWLGVRGVDIGPDHARILNAGGVAGFLIIAVVDGSPAHKGGLQGSTETVEADGITYHVGGDIITAVDGNEVREISDILVYLQREKSVGDAILLDVIRDGRSTQILIELEARPQ